MLPIATEDPQLPAVHASVDVAATVVAYQVSVYGVVPPVGFAVRVIDCPLSRVWVVGVGKSAVSAKVVATVEDATDVCVSGDVALSVTCSSKL